MIGPILLDSCDFQIAGHEHSPFGEYVCVLVWTQSGCVLAAGHAVLCIAGHAIHRERRSLLAEYRRAAFATTGKPEIGSGTPLGGSALELGLASALRQRLLTQL